MRIEIIGNIASGKTTLARILNRDFISTFEDFQSNPFWESFYEDPVSNSFETELTFTLQHYHAIRELLKQHKSFVCDFSMNLDRAYADVTLSGRRHKIYCDTLDELLVEVSQPTYLVHLICPEEVLLDRIKARGRPAESSIGLDYLGLLSRSIDSVLERASLGQRVIEIDSNLHDFAHNESSQIDILAIIEAAVGGGASKCA